MYTASKRSLKMADETKTKAIERLKALGASPKPAQQPPLTPVPFKPSDAAKLLGCSMQVFTNIATYKSDALATGVVYLEIQGSTVKLVSAEYLADRLAAYLASAGIIFNYSVHLDAVKTWTRTAPKLNRIPPAITTDPNELAFLHLDLSKVTPALNETSEERACPTWDYFISNCGANGEALMAYTWSIFNREDQSAQYLLLKGDGGDGKGSYCRWLQNLLSDEAGLYEAHAALDANDDRWPAQLVGKRLGIFNDINNTSIVMTSTFKQITGRDAVTINQKYEKAYTTRLDAKFILTTNKSVMLSGAEAEARRAIIISMERGTKTIPNYEAKIKEETWAFLEKCKTAYEKLYDRERFTILCDMEEFLVQSETFEADFDYIFDTYFEAGTEENELAGNAVQGVLRVELKTNHEHSGFIDFMKRKHGVQKLRRSGGIAYRGLKLKSMPGLTNIVSIKTKIGGDK